MLAVHEALDELVGINPDVAEIVKLRFFAGLELKECASVLGVTDRTAKRHWAFAKAWFAQRLGGNTSLSEK